MKTENLIKACHSFEFFFSELREAHTDAVNSEDAFAELSLFRLLEDAAKLRAQLDIVKDAANQASAAGKRK